MFSLSDQMHKRLLFVLAAYMGTCAGFLVWALVGPALRPTVNVLNTWWPIVAVVSLCFTHAGMAFLYVRRGMADGKVAAASEQVERGRIEALARYRAAIEPYRRRFGEQLAEIVRTGGITKDVLEAKSSYEKAIAPDQEQMEMEIAAMENSYRQILNDCIRRVMLSIGLMTVTMFASGLGTIGLLYLFMP